MKNEEANTTTTDQAAAPAAQGANVAPAKASSKKNTSKKKGAPKGPKSTKDKAKAAAPNKESKAAKKASKPGRPAKDGKPRAETKGSMILELIGRTKGATLAEIMKATEWQAHSVRGFISTARKKHGLKIVSAKNDAGERTYVRGVRRQANQDYGHLSLQPARLAYAAGPDAGLWLRLRGPDTDRTAVYRRPHPPPPTGAEDAPARGRRANWRRGDVCIQVGG